MAHFSGSDSLWSEENDRVPLKHRLKKLFRVMNPLPEHQNVDLSTVSVKKETEECASQDFHCTDSTQKEQTKCLIKEQTQNGEIELEQVDDNGVSKLGNFVNNYSVNETNPSVKSNTHIPNEFDNLDHIPLKIRRKILLSRKEDILVTKVTQDNKSMVTSDLTTLVNVKAEPFNENELLNTNNNNSMIEVKSEFNDELDHIFLSERKKLLLIKEVPFTLEYNNNNPIVSEYATPLKIYRDRKRKKTATDSVGKALEEDAPGLLQVLLEKGVIIDEMKLYGQTDHETDLDDSSLIESFSELEAIMLKLFSEKASLIKLGPIKCNKGDKPIYCLNCLFSLVEQSRYLKFRNWPVEWGWCRDLQSFIFVFQKHNRIVLERPEYGYATYFFELVESVSIDWQIKRLVTAMKLTSFSRVNLIENRSLMIGEDLSEEEARVLMEFGWVPNSGLGTMLNYRDRVVHDRKNETGVSEWREKIGKLLADGLNKGLMVSTQGFEFEEFAQIKMESN